MWSYIFTKCCETIKGPELFEEIINNDLIYEELEKSNYEKHDMKKWYCMSEVSGSYHSWNNIDPIFSKPYTYTVKQLVTQMLTHAPILKNIENPMVLTPCYEKRTDYLKHHSDNFEGEAELVGNYYIGSTQYLSVKSHDNKFFTKLDCSEGLVRNFHPLMNKLFLHGKFINKEIKKKHCCLTLRTSMIK